MTKLAEALIQKFNEEVTPPEGMRTKGTMILSKIESKPTVKQAEMYAKSLQILLDLVAELPTAKMILKKWEESAYGQVLKGEASVDEASMSDIIKAGDKKGLETAREIVAKMRKDKKSDKEIEDHLSDMASPSLIKQVLSEEKQYTDKDALKDHKRIMNKMKDRIKGLNDQIKSDQEMIKDKQEKMKSASDVKGKNNVPSQKDMYKRNIANIQARIEDTKKIIKEVQDELADRQKKHKEAEASVK